jgi:hypothetical protein
VDQGLVCINLMRWLWSNHDQTRAGSRGYRPDRTACAAGLLERGFDVSIYHRGAHEPLDLPDVRHIHGDPHVREQIEEDLRGLEVDVVVAAYGRTRHLAEILAQRTGQFIAIGGPPRYRGFYVPDSTMAGLPLPVSENADLVWDIAADAPPPLRFAHQIVATEQAVFAAIPSASYFIYPSVYGPRSVIPLEWSIIRRVLDGRREVLLPDGGRTVHSRGAARNLAEFLLLAVDQPEVAAGEVFNCADDVQLSLRQWVRAVLGAMGAEVDLVAVPAEVAPAFQAIYLPYPLHLAEHCILDTTKARHLLGYADVITPRDAVAESVAWYPANPVDDASLPPAFVDRFDYGFEDPLIGAWRWAAASMLAGVLQPTPDEMRPTPGPKHED